jgi:hypothetical protein
MRATVCPDRRGTGQRYAARPSANALGAGLARARAFLLVRARSAGLLALALTLASAAPLAAADDRIAVAHASAEIRHGTDPGAFVDAQFELQLPASLRDAVDHGIALYFAVDVEVTRSRWYWFDKRVLDDTIEYRLSFSPLTREYRLARGGLAQPFESLDQALGTLRRLSQWRIADTTQMEGGNTHARIRFRLDTSMLPKPFQVSALTDRDWTLVSDWANLPLAFGDGAGN